MRKVVFREHHRIREVRFQLKSSDPSRIEHNTGAATITGLVWSILSGPQSRQDCIGESFQLWQARVSSASLWAGTHQELSLRACRCLVLRALILSTQHLQRIVLFAVQSLCSLCSHSRCMSNGFACGSEVSANQLMLKSATLLPPKRRETGDARCAQQARAAHMPCAGN